MTSLIPVLSCPYLVEMWLVLTRMRSGNAVEDSVAVMSDLAILEHRAITQNANSDTLAVLAIFRKMAATEASPHWPPRTSGH